MVRRIRAARHYQSPDAPARRIADRAIPAISRALRTSLKAAAKTFDRERAKYLLQNGRLGEVADLLDWKHAQEAMRHPLAALGDVWLQGGAVGARKLNGAFTSRRRVVRFKSTKAAGGGETQHQRLLRSGANPDAAILPPESYLASVAVEKDQADLFNYDRFDPVTQTRIRAFQDQMLATLGDDSRATIEEVILRGLRLGQSVDEMVWQIRAVIGLTDRQATAVSNFRNMLTSMDPAALSRQLASASDLAVYRETLDAGGTLTQATIDQMTMNYAENTLTARALMIATTEATRAASMGLQDSYTQAVDRGVLPTEAVRQYWQLDLDEKTCDHCISVVDMNPDGVPLGQQFQSDDGFIDAPPYHPNCRCSLEFVTNLDPVPDDYEG